MSRTRRWSSRTSSRTRSSCARPARHREHEPISRRRGKTLLHLIGHLPGLPQKHGVREWRWRRASRINADYGWVMEFVRKDAVDPAPDIVWGNAWSPKHGL